MNDLERIPPAMRIPPPLVFVLAFLAGVGVQHAAGMTLSVPPVGRGIGMALVAGAALLVLCSLGLFLAERTTVIPFSKAAKLITWGPYRFTRNPMYVSLIVAYIGIAVGSSQLVALVLLPIPVLFVSTIVIPFEEQRMRKQFGGTYAQYCARVRRWL